MTDSMARLVGKVSFSSVIISYFSLFNYSLNTIIYINTLLGRLAQQFAAVELIPVFTPLALWRGAGGEASDTSMASRFADPLETGHYRFGET